MIGALLQAKVWFYGAIWGSIVTNLWQSKVLGQIFVLLGRVMDRCGTMLRHKSASERSELVLLLRNVVLQWAIMWDSSCKMM